MILLIAAEKGGVGKTSVSINLAAIAQANEIDTLLIDTDSTGSSTAWTRIRAEEGVTPQIPLVTVLTNAAATIASMAPKHDLIVVDVGARSYSTMLDVARIADLIIVPTTPGQFEAESTLQLFDAFRAMDPRHKNGKVPAYALLNQISTNARSKEEADLRGLLNEANVPVLQSVLRSRKAWRDASRSGRALHELQRPDFNAHAADEMRAVYAEAESLAQ